MTTPAAHFMPTRLHRIWRRPSITYQRLLFGWAMMCTAAVFDLAGGHPSTIFPGRVVYASLSDRAMLALAAVAVAGFPVLLCGWIVRRYRGDMSAADAVNLGNGTALFAAAVGVALIFLTWMMGHQATGHATPAETTTLGDVGQLLAAGGVAFATLRWYGRWAFPRAFRTAQVPTARVAAVGHDVVTGTPFLIRSDGERADLPDPTPWPKEGLVDDVVVAVLPASDVRCCELYVTAFGYCHDPARRA